MTDTWLIWWTVLCAAAAANVVAWRYSVDLLERRRPQFSAEAYARRRLLLWLSAVYVVGCGFRSVFPMVDVPRLCLHDTWVSRIIVGRSVATIAELAFAAQWALLLREAGKHAGGGITPVIARIVFPTIVVAELFSWAAVLTTNYLLHAVENSLWTLIALMVIASLISLGQRFDERSRRLFGAALIAAASYVAFMLVVDVPMYVARWQADVAGAHVYLTLAEGLRQILALCVVNRDWAAWQEDVPWLTLYFTFGVWISIALVHVPSFRLAPRRGAG